MKMLIKRNNFSSTMKEFDVTYSQVISLIKNPHKTAKNDTKLWIFGNIVNAPELDDSHFARCIAENIEELNAIQLDFDGNYTIKEWQGIAKTIYYLLYTTHSYDGITDRFRVIIPLKRNLPCKYLKNNNVRKYLIDKFSEADSSCFSAAHWQLIPTCNKNYYYEIHRGTTVFDLPIEKFDNIIKNEPVVNYANVVHNIKITDFLHMNSQDFEAINLLHYAEQEIKDAQKGSRNTTYWRYVWMLAKNGFNKNDIYTYLLPFIDSDMHKEFTAMIKRI